MTLDEIASATYAAMLSPPPFVELGHALLAAETIQARATLLDLAAPGVADAAMQYLAEPEETRERTRRLTWMRADPRRVAALKHYFRHHVADFICEYGTTYDPRLIADGKNPLVHLVLFPKQRELVQFIVDRIARKQHGLVAKGRDVGATATCVATLLSLCMLEDRFATGVGSSKEDKLDLTGAPDTIFAHADNFLTGVPEEFKGTITRLYMRINFGNGSSFVGEAGNECGRGGRKIVYLMDEFAFHPFPEAVDAALSQNTNTVLWVSTFHGPAGPFYDKSNNKAIPRLDITWRDRPDRDEAWYEDVKSRTDPVIFAQEVDANPLASREGAVIPALWVTAAIGLHTKLGIKLTGRRYGALDIGDTSDRSALAIRHGIYLEHIESWSGAGSDLMKTAAKAFGICDARGIDDLLFDCDGLGASMRGDARTLNEQRAEKVGLRPIKVTEYRGSASPLYPTRTVPRTNLTWEDYVANRKAQSWMNLRFLFEQSYHAAQGEPYDPDSIVSLNPDMPELSRLIAELSQPTMSATATGRILIDKLGPGERSPNLGDAACMCLGALRDWPMVISDAIFSEGWSDDTWGMGFR